MKLTTHRHRYETPIADLQVDQEAIIECTFGRINPLHNYFEGPQSGRETQDLKRIQSSLYFEDSTDAELQFSRNTASPRNLHYNKRFAYTGEVGSPVSYGGRGSLTPVKHIIDFELEF